MKFISSINLNIAVDDMWYYHWQHIISSSRHNFWAEIQQSGPSCRIRTLTVAARLIPYKTTIILFLENLIDSSKTNSHRYLLVLLLCLENLFIGLMNHFCIYFTDRKIFSKTIFYNSSAVTALSVMLVN